VVESLKVDEIAPLYVGNLLGEDRDQPFVLFVVPEAKVGGEFVSEEFVGLDPVSDQAKMDLSPDGTESISIPT
jgi:hypothetical protein